MRDHVLKRYLCPAVRSRLARLCGRVSRSQPCAAIASGHVDRTPDRAAPTAGRGRPPVGIEVSSPHYRSTGIRAGRRHVRPTQTARGRPSLSHGFAGGFSATPSGFVPCRSGGPCDGGSVGGRSGAGAFDGDPRRLRGRGPRRATESPRRDHRRPRRAGTMDPASEQKAKKAERTKAKKHAKAKKPAKAKLAKRPPRSPSPRNRTRQGGKARQDRGSRSRRPPR